MSNITITNLDLGGVVYKDGTFTQDVLTFSTSGTYEAGTILARDSVSLKLIPFVKGGSTNENGIPKALLTYDVTRTSAGDSSVSALVSGTVRKEKLIINADGDDSNIDKVVLDQLRSYSIIAENVQELNILDNQ